MVNLRSPEEIILNFVSEKYKSIKVVHACTQEKQRDMIG